MKLHDRDWYGVVFNDHRKRQSYKSAKIFLQHLISSRECVWDEKPFEYDSVKVWRFEFISSRRYFTFTGAEAQLEEMLDNEDTPRFIKSKGRIGFGYPCYLAAIARDGETFPEVVLAIPFAALSREIWLETILPEKRGEVLFRRCDISKLHKLMKSSEEQGLMQLRSGRAVIEPDDDPNLKSIVLNGPNVMDSNLYKQLFEKGIPNFHPRLDDLYSKVAFFGEHLPSIVAYMDKHGNYRFRPGIHGKRLASFGALVTHLNLVNILIDESSCPLLRYWQSNDDSDPSGL